MPVWRLYEDFFSFLEHRGEDPWEAYQRWYVKRHPRFFEAYFRTFPDLDAGAIADRVRGVKEGDYGLLRSLIAAEDPGLLAEEALGRSRAVLPLASEPSVFLFVGFFSADGFILEVEDQPSIALGLERFKSFRDLSLLTAHEYGHLVERSLPPGSSPPPAGILLSALRAEGLAVLFTERAFPEITLHRHLFLSPERLQWARENEEALLDLAGADLLSDKLLPVLFGPGDPAAGLPPRLGYFIARQRLRSCLNRHGAEELGEICSFLTGLLPEGNSPARPPAH